MRDCPKCGNSYPQPFQYCPVDGAPLEVSSEEPDEHNPLPLDAIPTEPSISIRTLMKGLGLLLLAGFLSFNLVFLYQYFRPKYGGLVIKTTPPGAIVTVDGKQRGVSPLTLVDIRSGGHLIRAAKEGYKELIQQIEVLPYTTENLHWPLDPLVPHLTNEQLAEIESWRKKLDTAQKENILLPPPEDYNVLYFANKILGIDPASAYALEVKNKLAEAERHSADLAYAREDWLQAEKRYKNLALIFPNDISINEKIADIAAKIDASIKDREKQIADWTARAEAALKFGALVPPEKDNAFEALQNIRRLDRNNAFAATGLVRVKEMLQNRGDTKISNGDWPAARNEFRLALQYFPDDEYSKNRLSMVEQKLAEAAQSEQQRLQRLQEEQQSRARVVNLRQSALNSYRSGAWAKSISEWQEYLKVEPNSDEAYFYMGACYLEQKQLDTAILNFEKSIALNNSNAGAHVYLGLLYDRHRGDFARAVEHLKKALQLGGAERFSPDRLQGMIQELQGRAQLETLQKIPFAVEHKHAFSSCKGNFLITAQGVEFKTRETDHSFYEAYTNLRSFSVLEDDVSIRTRNNKKYNFHMLNQGEGERLRRVAARHTQVTD